MSKPPLPISFSRSAHSPYVCQDKGHRPSMVPTLQNFTHPFRNTSWYPARDLTTLKTMKTRLRTQYLRRREPPSGGTNLTFLLTIVLSLSSLKATCGEPDPVNTAAQKLENLRMLDHHHITKFNVKFNKYSAITGFGKCAFGAKYYKGVAPNQRRASGHRTTRYFGRPAHPRHQFSLFFLGTTRRRQRQRFAVNIQPSPHLGRRQPRPTPPVRHGRNPHGPLHPDLPPCGKLVYEETRSVESLGT